MQRKQLPKRNRRRRNQAPRRRRRNGGGDAPFAKKFVFSNSGAKVRKITRNMQTIMHREYLGPITNTKANTFNIARTVSINPGLAETFPWLNGTARGYESYRFNALRFEYEPNCGAQTAGKIIMSVDYDALDEPPSSSIIALNAAGAKSTQVWSNLVLTASPEQMNKGYKSKFIRVGEVGPNADLKTYDAGKLYVAVEGVVGATQTIGDLYINFSVDLLTPQMILANKSMSTQTFKSVNGIATSPLKDPIIQGINLVEQTNNGNWDRFTFKEFGYYLTNFAGRSMKNPGGGSFNGGRNIETMTQIFNGKLPEQGQLIENLIIANPGEYFDLAGSGAPDVNDYKNNFLSIQRINLEDYLNWSGLLEPSTSAFFAGDVVPDFT